MLSSLFRFVDRLSIVFSRVAEFVAMALVVSMIYEVSARYLFNAPTLWAFDIAYMATGTLFVLGAAQALREDAHVRIDFLSSRFPQKVRAGIEGTVFLIVLCPIFAGLSWVATKKAWRAFETGEVETVSPWAPLMWPFYGLLAIGLFALCLQLCVQGLRAYQGIAGSPKEVDI
ncbi:TRAP transporter small permease subunit [Thalassospiraceae bacterium SW-3-3]|nr:TRAP transporter small permease subunit [Thalassospiraceae bacterium SW-3-3]